MVAGDSDSRSGRLVLLLSEDRYKAVFKDQELQQRFSGPQYFSGMTGQPSM
jgi:hypothetical protein